MVDGRVIFSKEWLLEDARGAIDISLPSKLGSKSAIAVEAKRIEQDVMNDGRPGYGPELTIGESSCGTSDFSDSLEPIMGDLEQ